MKLNSKRLPATRLLVSVRDAAEAEAAIAGGAGLIDIKEPLLGPLGKASNQVIENVIQRVGGRCPVSAALGELLDLSDGQDFRFGPGVSFVKCGLSGANGVIDWRQQIRSLRSRVESQVGAKLVVAAYADWRPANSPSLSDLVDFSIAEQAPAFLIDTYAKGGGTLLDWLSFAELMQICSRLRIAGIPTALAGSLDREQIRRLRPVRPAWFAVRGAACIGGRDGTIQTDRVRSLAVELTPQSIREGKP